MELIFLHIIRIAKIGVFWENLAILCRPQADQNCSVKTREFFFLSRILYTKPGTYYISSTPQSNGQ
jgi:hypothetical protein